MGPLRIDIGEILGQRATQIDVDALLETGELVAGDTTFTPVGPAHVIAAIINAGDGVVLTGTVAIRLETECSRCLERFEFDVTSEVEGLFTTPEKATELPEEQEWEPIGDGVIDLGHAVESAIRLELPFAPLHDESCEGICSTCGTNLNEDTCSCADAPGASGPFAALQGMFDEPGTDDA